MDQQRSIQGPELASRLQLTTVDDRARTFIELCLLAAGLEGLLEIESRLKRDSSSLRARFLEAFERELISVKHFHSLILERDRAGRRQLLKEAHRTVEELCLRARRELTSADLRRFTEVALTLAAEVIRSQKSFKPNFLAHHLDRAFDQLDELLGLSFNFEKPPQANEGSERAFAGAGIGVQSDYAAIFDSLVKLAPEPESSMIDLGSGYGRVGLVMGLLRPDMEHIGYELVEHRVAMSNASAERIGAGERIRFLAQDLADPQFVIPKANIYYLYDPFTEETYRYVMQQLRAIGRERGITIATRGHAVHWVGEALALDGWSSEIAATEGKLSLFKSPPGSEA